MPLTTIAMPLDARTRATIEALRGVDIPRRLRCSSCDKLAVDAAKLLCCDETVCGTCQLKARDNCSTCGLVLLCHGGFRPHRSLCIAVESFLDRERKKKTLRDVHRHRVGGSSARGVVAEGRCDNSIVELDIGALTMEEHKKQVIDVQSDIRIAALDIGALSLGEHNVQAIGEQQEIRSSDTVAVSSENSAKLTNTRHLLSLPNELQDMIFELAYPPQAGLKLADLEGWEKRERDRRRTERDNYVARVLPPLIVEHFLVCKLLFVAASRAWTSAQTFSNDFDGPFSILGMLGIKSSRFGILGAYLAKLVMPRYWRHDLVTYTSLRELCITVDVDIFLPVEPRFAWVDELTGKDLDTVVRASALSQLSGLRSFEMKAGSCRWANSADEQQIWVANVKRLEDLAKRNALRPRIEGTSAAIERSLPVEEAHALYPGSSVNLAGGGSIGPQAQGHKQRTTPSSSSRKVRRSKVAAVAVKSPPQLQEAGPCSTTSTQQEVEPAALDAAAPLPTSTHINEHKSVNEVHGPSNLEQAHATTESLNTLLRNDEVGLKKWLAENGFITRGVPGEDLPKAEVTEWFTEQGLAARGIPDEAIPEAQVMKWFTGKGLITRSVPGKPPPGSLKKPEAAVDGSEPPISENFALAERLGRAGRPDTTKRADHALFRRADTRVIPE